MNDRLPYDPRFLHLIYSALLMVQLVLTVVVIYVTQEDADVFCSLAEPSNVIVPAFALLLVVGGRLQWNNGMREISNSENLLDKLELLTRIHVWQWVLVQLATLLLLAYTLVEGNYYYFIFALVNIIYFFTLRPKLFTFSEGI